MTRKQLRGCYTRYSVAVLLSLALMEAAAFGLSWAARILFADYLSNPLYYSVIGVAVNDIACYIPPVLVFALILRKLPRADSLPVDILDPWEKAQALVFCFGAGYLVSFATEGLMTALGGLLGLQSRDITAEFTSGMPFWLNFLAVAVLAPICEELVFRKVLLDRLRGLGDGSAVLLTGLAFGIYHMNFFQFGYAVVLGMVFSVIVLLTGSIRDAIFLHMCINGFSVLVSEMPEEGQTVCGLVILGCIALSVVQYIKDASHYQFSTGNLPFTRYDKQRACCYNPMFLLMLAVGAALSMTTAFG